MFTKDYTKELVKRKGEFMDNIIYTVEEVAVLLNRSKPTAYRIIKQINEDYCKKNKLNPKIMSGARISKELFHKYYPI